MHNLRLTRQRIVYSRSHSRQQLIQSLPFQIALICLPGGRSTVATAPSSPCIWTLANTETTLAGRRSLTCRLAEKSNLETQTVTLEQQRKQTPSNDPTPHHSACQLMNLRLGYRNQPISASAPCWSIPTKKFGEGVFWKDTSTAFPSLWGVWAKGAKQNKANKTFLLENYEMSNKMGSM